MENPNGERASEQERGSESSISTGRFPCQLRKRTAAATAEMHKQQQQHQLKEHCTNACSGPEHVYKYIYVD